MNHRDTARHSRKRGHLSGTVEHESQDNEGVQSLYLSGRARRGRSSWSTAAWRRLCIALLARPSLRERSCVPAMFTDNDTKTAPGRRTPGASPSTRSARLAKTLHTFVVLAFLFGLQVERSSDSCSKNKKFKTCYTETQRGIAATRSSVRSLSREIQALHPEGVAQESPGQRLG